MTPFGYLSVLISIILGLALTELLSRLQRMVHARSRVTFHWLPVVWAVLIFVLVVQWWWAAFGLRNQASWNFFSFLLILLNPVLLYLSASLVFPEVDAGRASDLRVHYFETHRVLFGTLTLVNLVSLARAVGPGDVQAAALSAVGALLAGSLAAVRNPRWHAVATILTAVLLASFIVLETLRIG